MKLLFVCTGNICRSPTAEGIFRHQASHKADALLHAAAGYADSAGLGDWHAGETPDARSIKAARARGYDLSALRARQIRREDFHRFDLILAMDRSHQRALRAAAPQDASARICLYLDFAPRLAGRDVPDPFYGGSADFEHVLDLCEAATPGLLAHVLGA